MFRAALLETSVERFRPTGTCWLSRGREPRTDRTFGGQGRRHPTIESTRIITFAIVPDPVSSISVAHMSRNSSVNARQLASGGEFTSGIYTLATSELRCRFECQQQGSRTSNRRELRYVLELATGSKD